MLVSIITLSYNSSHLHKAVDSVLCQDYRHIQYILVDDGSEGFSLQDVYEYVAKHAKDNIKEFAAKQNPRNLGTVKTANIGLKAARGDLVFFLAGDDEFADERVISDWVREFENSEKVAMTALRDAYDGEVFIERLPNKQQVDKLLTMTCEELFVEIAAENFIFGCQTAYVTHFLKGRGGFDERYRLIEDHPMILRLLRDGIKPHFYDRVVVRWQTGGTSSPGAYNAEYERDVHMICQNEVAPYSAKAAKVFRKWKNRRKMEQRLCMAYGKSARIAYARICFHIRHPIETLGKILCKMRFGHGSDDA